MNVKLDKFLVVARSDYIFKACHEESFKNVFHDKMTGKCMDMLHPQNRNRFTHSTRSAKDIADVVSMFEFIMESIFEGLSFKKFVLVDECHNMSYITYANYVHTRVDNGELINVQIPFVFTDTDVILVSPFNVPNMDSELNTCGQQFALSIVNYEKDYPKEGFKNKVALLDKVFNETNKSGSLAESIKKIMDVVATDIHMQTEYMIKDLAVIPETSFRLVNDSDDIVNSVKSVYGVDLDKIDGEIISPNDFTPILLSSDGSSRAVAVDVKLINGGKTLTQGLVGLESFYEVIKPKVESGGTAPVVREVLIRCPGYTKPLIIELPAEYKYVGYNEIMKPSANGDEVHILLDSNCATVDNTYIPVSEVEEKLYGTEAMEMRRIGTKLNDRVLIPLKKYGVVKGTKLYEICLPLAKLPAKPAKEVFNMVRGIVKSSTTIEKETSEVLREKLMKDEMDVLLMRIEIILTNYVTYLGLALFTGNMLTAFIGWFLMRERVTKIRRKALERTERRVISKIREYEKKIEFATQESDYKSVKNLTHIMDTYKAMLDKLREIKTEVFKNPEKFTDTYSEYN